MWTWRIIIAGRTLCHPDLEPRHPGALLRALVLPSLGISVSAAAERLHITRPTLHHILAERAAITPATALRFGKFCGNGPELRLHMQDAYDLWHAERELRSEIDPIETASAG